MHFSIRKTTDCNINKKEAASAIEFLIHRGAVAAYYLF